MTGDGRIGAPCQRCLKRPGMCRCPHIPTWQELMSARVRKLEEQLAAVLEQLAKLAAKGEP